METINNQNENITNEEQDTYNDNQYLTFCLGDETYAIGILEVIEIIRQVKITKLPEMPQYVKGIINLRGKIIPVIDVRLRFELQEKEYGNRTCIIIVKINDLELGMIVDNVSEVLEIAANNINATPTLNNSRGNKYIKGIGKVDNEIKIILDLSKMVFAEDIEKLKKAS